MKGWEQNKAGIRWIILGVMLVVAWRGVILLRQTTARGQRAAVEIGSVPHFGQRLMANHGNTAVAYTRYGETGVGWYLWSRAARTNQFLVGVGPENYGSVPEVYGWSPDDRRFAYVQPTAAGKMALIICDGISGEKLAELQHPGFSGPGMFTWLAATRFGYLLGAGDRYNFCLAEQKPDGTWAKGAVVPGITLAKEGGFTAISDHAVVWQDRDDNLQVLELSSGTIRPLWNTTPTNRLSFFSYSLRNQELLLDCVTPEGRRLIRYALRTYSIRQNAPGGEAGNLTFRSQSNWRDDSPLFVSPWKGDLPRQCYLSRDGLNEFHFKTANNSDWTSLPWRGGVAAHTALNEDHLVVLGHPTNEMIGLWDYEVVSGTLECLVPILDRPLKQAAYVVPVSGVITNNLGKPTSYSLWTPVGLSSKRKYPAIIGQTVNGESFAYQQVAANCGCYFAMANRPYWLGGKLNEWPADVLALYERLKRNPNVDATRIFLFARSAETPYLCNLLAEKPELWAGVMLFDPTSLPPLDAYKSRRMLLITGQDVANARQLREYQTQAVQRGIAVRLILQERTGHYPPSVSSMRERAGQLARYLKEEL